MNRTGSQRLDTLPANSFFVMNEKIADLETEGHHVIRMDIGSPDLPPPGKVIEQLSLSAQQPSSHGYQSHRGTFRYREAWAEYYRKNHGVNLDPDSQILPLQGSKEGIFYLSLALIDPGDLVLIPDPGYQTYTAGTLFASGTPRFISCHSGEDFIFNLLKMTPDDLERAKLLWVNFPHNPTGATINPDQVRQLIDFAQENEILLCHDAAYSQIVYDGYQASSFLEGKEIRNNVIEFNSLSKSYNMAGWRLGMIAGREDIIQKLLWVKTQADSGLFLPMMEAGEEALITENSWLENRNLIYQTRRDLVVDALSDLNIGIDKPLGGIYIWFPVPGKFRSEEFTSHLLDQYHIALAPGTIFGAGGEGFVRLSLTADEDQIRDGMRRLSKAIKTIDEEQ